MDINDLKRIGLSEGELKVYSALLELGESTRTELAKKSGISPSKIYDVANRLMEKGIISSVVKNGVIHFSAANPDKIVSFLDLKEEEIKKEKQMVNELMPMLLAKYQKTDEDTDIQVFYGWDGMKTAFDEITKKLGKKDINYVFGASTGQNSKQSDIFFSQYFKKVEKAGYGVRIIFNENVRYNKQRTEYYSKKPRHEVRYLHNDTFTELNLYKDTVLVILLLKKPVVIRIKNKEASESFRKFFDSMWNLAKA